MVSWEGTGTELTHGFATLRMQTNHLQCCALESVHGETYTTDPVQVLCRAMRLAPACYRCFKMEAMQAHSSLQVEAEVTVVFCPDDEDGNSCDDYDTEGADDDGIRRLHRELVSVFDSIAELAAAMQQCTAAEGLRVSLSRD